MFRYLRIFFEMALITILILFSQISSAQTNKILKGTVYENTEDNLLAGATVTLVNSENRVLKGTTTDKEGRFEMDMIGGATTIIFSYLGLKEQSRRIDSGIVEFKIVLVRDVRMMEEVSVLLNKQEKASLGLLDIDKTELASAIAYVDMTHFDQGANVGIDQLLQGAAPGLQVVAASGDPGASASIRIRGISTISGISDPLWIIDGSEVISGNYNVESISDFGYSPIGDIDPQDIESISILKDASATALYGSRGANGVIVITTKRGSKGKPQLTASVRYTTTRAPKQIPLLTGDEQRIFLIESMANSAGGDNGTFLPMLRGDLSRPMSWKYNNNIDWVKAITRNGFYQDYNFNIKGGGERLSYYWGTGYVLQYGTTKGTGYDRFNTRFNLDYKVSDKVKVSAQLSYTNSLTDKRGSEHPGGRNPIADAQARAAFFPIYEESGAEYYIDRSTEALAASSTARYNPMALIDYSSYLTRTNRYGSTISVDYKIRSNINFRSQVSLDFHQAADEYFLPAYATDAKLGETLYNQGQGIDGFEFLLINNNRLTWDAINSKRHHLLFTGLLNLYKYRSESLTVGYNNTPSSLLRTPEAAGAFGATNGSFSTNKNISLIGQAHYVFNGRYIATLTLNSEGDSKYGNQNDYTAYPSVGLSWKLNEEKFLRNAGWITELRPRFAYGVSGKVPGDRNMKTITYLTTTGYLGNTISYPASFAYDDISSERTEDFNYGLTFALFKGRISSQIDYYKRTTTDLIVSVNTPSVTGFSTQRKNFGSISNSGLEFGITAEILKRSANLPSWKTSFNIATNKNVLNELAEGYDGSYDRDINGFKSRLIEGRTIGGFYGLKTLGVYANDEDAILKDSKGNMIFEADGITPKYMRYGDQNGHIFRGGDIIYEDINGDGVINDLDIIQVGDGNPLYFGGWTNTTSWKEWTFNIGFTYQYGNDVINQSRRTLENMIGTNNYAKSVTNRWRSQGDITDMPRAERNAVWNDAPSSRWVEDASYLRLKTLSLSYQFSLHTLEKWGLGVIKNVNATLSATNLYTWTNYLGVDPEIPLGNSITMFGIDQSRTAPPISYTFLIRVMF